MKVNLDEVFSSPVILISKSKEEIHISERTDGSFEIMIKDPLAKAGEPGFSPYWAMNGSIAPLMGKGN